MNWTLISGVGALLCIRLVCHVIQHAILSRNSGERRRARQDRIEWVQSEGKSARFLINADKFEIWAERHPYRFFAIQAAGTVLLAMAASRVVLLLAYGKSLADWLRISLDHFPDSPWGHVTFLVALAIVVVALAIWECRESRASAARTAVAKLEAQIEADE